MRSDEPIELEASSGLVPVADPRPRLDELPPVRLIAVDDVRLPAPPGMAGDLDSLYLDLLEFSREEAEGETQTGIVYRGENFRLRFEIVEAVPLPRDGVRPIGIEVRSLRDAERKLFENQVEYQRQRGLLPGHISLLLQDPAGNWIELFETTFLG
jgi:hypothetical protein